MKKIVKIVFGIIFGFITFYSVFILIGRLIVKEETPSFFGYKNFIVLTGSMNPFLQEGDIIFVKKTNDIKEGDIVAFRFEDAIITHRVVEIVSEDGNKMYQTKGDANNDRDPELIEEDKIEGEYQFKIPKMGNVILFLRSPFGTFIILFILVSGFLWINIDIFNRRELVKGGVGHE